ncbi:hypothetical protein ES703_108223 [subsurface metagenome]
MSISKKIWLLCISLILLIFFFAFSNPNEKLFKATTKGDIELVKRALKDGANINTTTKNGLSSLHIAASKGFIEIAKILIKNNANVNLKDREGWTPLYYAVKNNKLTMAKFLIDNGADIDESLMKSRYSKTVMQFWKYINKRRGLYLHYYAEIGDIQQVKKFITAGSNINREDGLGDTPLIIAAGDNNYNIVKLLLEHGADPEISPYTTACPALEIALHAKNFEIAKLLIEKGKASVKGTGKKRQYHPIYLHKLTGRNNYQAVKFLLQYGADVNEKQYGETALHITAREGYIEIAKLLIQHGANLHAKTTDSQNINDIIYPKGITPLGMAKRAKQINMIRLLQKYEK